MAFLDLAPPRERRVPGVAVAHRHRLAAGSPASGSVPAGRSGATCPSPTDFIFAIIAEELGLVGVVAVLGLVPAAGVLRRADRAALPRPIPHARRRWHHGLAIVQTIVNIGGVTGMMPLTGLTLPFLSFGGSSLLVTMTAMGLLLNVARRWSPATGRAASAGAGRPASPSSPGAEPPVTCSRRSPSPRAWSPPATTRRRSTTSVPRGASRPGSSRPPFFPHTFLDVIGLQRRLDRSNLSFPLKLVAARPTRPPPPSPAAPRRRLGRRVRQPARRDRRPRPADPGRRRQLRPPSRAVEPAHRPLRCRQRRGVPRFAPAPSEVHGSAAAPRSLPSTRSRPGAAPGRLGLPLDRFVVAVVAGRSAPVLNEARPPWSPVGGAATSPCATSSGALPRQSPRRRPGLGILYQVIGYEEQMPLVYAAADLVVARAGASTIAELTAIGVPSILVPWAGAAEDHQADSRWLGALVRGGRPQGPASVLAASRSSRALMEIRRRALRGDG